DGARIAASWQNRGACGQIPTGDKPTIVTEVTNRIATVTNQPFTVTVSQNPAVAAGATPPCAAPGTTPQVVVNVVGCVPFVMPVLPLPYSVSCPDPVSGAAGRGLSVNRSVVFHDELRG